LRRCESSFRVLQTAQGKSLAVCAERHTDRVVAVGGQSSALIDVSTADTHRILTLWHTQAPVRRSEPPMSLLLVLAFC
jgi:hypothetical protein